MPNPTSSYDRDPPLRQGSGAGCVVLLHAAGSAPRAYDRLARGLAVEGWRAVAPALRVGRPVSGAGGGLAPAVTDVAALLEDERSVGPLVLLGHSMGGLVALRLALAGARAAALVLYEPIVLSLLDAADPRDRALREADGAVVAGFRAALAAGAPEAGIAGFVDALGAGTWQTLPPAARAGLVGRAGEILAEAEAVNAEVIDADAVRSLSMPILLLQGDRSPTLLHAMSDRLAALLGDVERVTVAGAGHMGPLAMPGEIAQLVRDFLARRLG